MRLIGYVAASRLAAIWRSELKLMLSAPLQTRDDIRTLAYLFPPLAIEPIRQLAHGTQALLKYASNHDLPALTHAPTSAPDAQGLLTDRRSVEAALTSPFLALYRQKELRARELVLEYGRHVFKMSEYQEVLDRLKIGFTSPEIVSWLTPSLPDDLAQHFVSLFLDRAIDRGVVVPITAVKDGAVYRA